MVLRLRRPAPNWEKAKCLGTAPPPHNDPWFDNSDDGYENFTHEGAAFCNGAEDGVICPIRHECLIFGAVNNERFGVWGGMSEQDRRLMRKVFPWDSKTPAEPHPEWRWRSHEELVEKYKSRFSSSPPEYVEEEEDDE